VPEIVGRVLAARGIDLDSAPAFLNPTLREMLPDPSAFKDMDKAVERIVRALTQGETIAVFGDYDVDGACATALLTRFFTALGRETVVYIPDRRTEGYGPSAAAMKKIRATGASVLITVDCGTTAFEALTAAAECGLDTVVVDHHMAEARMPPAFAIVNPNRLDESGQHGALCAVGVAFLLVVAINRALRDAFWYGEGHEAPDLMRLLDLVALGTICDVVPLTGANRALVAQGLKIMGRRGNLGIAALCDIAKLAERPDCYHAGFVIGPRVNASGRLGDCSLGARLLATEDAAEARALALRLDTYNEERRAIEAGVLDAALADAERQVASGVEVIVCAGKGWHQGVVGIVAGRLRERFDRPALAIGLEGGIGRGSGRSVPGVALGPAVIAAAQAGILINGGGHAAAAGFTVAEERVAEFTQFLCERVRREVGGVPPAPVLALDGALSPEGATRALCDDLERLAPFGAGNPRPRFALASLRIAFAEPVGTDHVRCRLISPAGGPALNAIAFRAAGAPLGRALLEAKGGTLHVAGYLRADDFQGRAGAQLVIEDAA